MFKAAADAMARVVRDKASRLAAICLAVALTLAGVTRGMFEMSSGGLGSFPMPGDNVVMLACCLACCAVASHWHCGVARLACSRLGRVSAAGFALVCVAALQACRLLDPASGSQLLFFAGAFVRVAGLVLLIWLFARVDASDMGLLAAQVALALALAVAADLVFLLLAPGGVAVVSLALPFAAWWCLKGIDDAAAEGGAGAARPTADGAGAARPVADGPRPDGADPAAQPGLPHLRLLTFGLYGAVGGLASSQAHALAPTAMAQPSLLHSCLVNDLGLVVGCVLLVVGTFWLLGRRADPFALRCLLVPAFLVAIFLAPLLSGFMGEVVPVLMALSQALFYGMLWMFPQPAAYGQRMRWFSAACGFFFVGTYAGMWLGGDFLPASGAGDVYMVVAALALAVLIMVEFAPRLFGSRAALDEAREPACGPAEPQPAPAQPAGADPADAALEANAALDALARHAAQAWGLTPRECAVLPGLLRGRSVAWVAQSLTVSKNTVHTHVRNIYQKAGVHSQQELIDAAEAL